MARTRTTLSVSEIMQNTNSSTDLGNFDDWDRVLAAKVSHDHFDWIVDQIMRDGFTMPIVLHGDRWGNGGWTLGNGHHRMCAAILLGLDTIPVVITDSPWDWVEDSHDGSEELPAPSFDYWEMISGDLAVKGLYGDCDGQAWRAQFANGESDRLTTCAECGDCATCCGGHDAEVCHECEELIEYGRGHSAHLALCREIDYRLITCQARNTGDWAHGCHYAIHACPALRAEWHAEALAEHIARGYLPGGVWHPAGVLSEAYEAHAMWLRDEPMRKARARYEANLHRLRAAVRSYASDAELIGHAQNVADAWQEYANL